MGTLQGHRRKRGEGARRRRPDARCPFLSGSEAQLRRKPAAQDGERRCLDLPRRGQGELPADLGRTARPGVASATGAEGAGDRRRRPRRRDDAEHARDDRTHACDRFRRRHLVVLFARFRRAGRPRPLRPDRPQALHRLRRLLVQRQAAGRGLEGACGGQVARARPPSSFPMPETAPRLRRPSRAG